MSYNGSGTFQINTTGQPVITGTVISSTAFNALTADLATGLSTAITKDGQTATTARIPFAAGISSTLVTDSSSVSTGSILTAGGVGIAKAAYVGTTLNVGGASTFTGAIAVDSVTDSSSTTTGSIQTDGGVGIAKALFVGTTANIAGVLSTTSPNITTSITTPSTSFDLINATATTLNLGGAATAVNVGAATGTMTVANTTLAAKAITASTTLSVTGVTTVQAGTAALPAITTTGDTNTGIFFPAADTIAFTEGGAEAMRIDSSGNVGIGISSPDSSNKLQVAGDIGLSWDSNKFIGMKFGAGGSYKMGLMLNEVSRECKVWSQSSDSDDKITFYTGPTPSERMRISSAGRVSINTTYADTQLNIAYNGGSVRGVDINNTVSGNQDAIYFRTNGTNVGRINTDASNTSYVTSSDYRLKENITPMTGGLSKVALLKPVTYKWKVDGSNGQGFIAHELAEVVPDCVTGEKDAVETYTDEDGNEQTRIKPQGIDTSFLVATLTVAIQEQQALITALTARITALETK